MNDLAEKALEGLDVARQYLRDHPMVSLSATGFVIGAMVVASGGRATAARADRPLTSWLGLQDVRSEAIGSTAGSIMLAGVLTLAMLWVAALWIVISQAVPLTRVWWVAGVWATPFVFGPPLMDTSVYTYVAYGRLLRAGHDPYDVGPSALGDSPIVAAIDPARRSTASAAGPLGTLLQHLAVSVGNGDLLVTVLVWRVTGVLAAIWIARSVAELTTPLPRLAPAVVVDPAGSATTAGAKRILGGVTTPAGAVAVVALNPLLLLYVVSSPHLDAVTTALVLAAVVAAGQRRWWRALALATLGGCISAPGLVAVPLIAGVHWFGRRRTRVWPVIARDSVVVAVSVLVPSLLQPDGWGWLRNAQSQLTSDRTPYSLAGAVEKGLSVVVRVASYDDLAAGGRVTAGVAAVCVCLYLLATVQRRALGLSIGYALFWLAVLAPVLHPWYLLWGVLILLPLVTGQARIALVAVSVAACVLAPQGFDDLGADVVTGVSLAGLAVAAGVALWLIRPQPAPARPTVGAGTP